MSAILSGLFIRATTVLGGSYQTDLPTAPANGSQLNTIIQLVIAVGAALAVLTIVISGFRMVLSRGDPQAVAKARSAIAYAVIGLIIAIFAEVLVAFVLRYL